MNGVADGQQDMRGRWPWLLALGVLLVVLGLVAVAAMALVTTLWVIYLGFVLLIAGASHVASAFSARAGSGLFFHLLAGLVDGIVGVVLVARPGPAAAVLTLLLAVSFLAGGAFRIAWSAALKYPGWPLSVASGVVGVLLGVFILIDFDETRYWVIGLFVGIDMISRGLSWVMTALALRRPPAFTA